MQFYNPILVNSEHTLVTPGVGLHCLNQRLEQPALAAVPELYVPMYHNH